MEGAHRVFSLETQPAWEVAFLYHACRDVVFWDFISMDGCGFDYLSVLFMFGSVFMRKFYGNFFDGLHLFR